MKRLILPLYFCLTTPFILVAHEQIHEADRYFQATLFEKALPLYIQLSNEKLSDDEHTLVRIRLAQSYAALGEINKAIAVLQDQKDPESLDLLAQLYAQNKEYTKSYQVLEKYFALYGNENGKRQDELNVRIGEALILQGTAEKAKPYFEKIVSSSPLYPQAQLYLAQIDLQEKKYQAVIDRLTRTDLEIESFLVLGEAYFQTGNYEQAAVYLQKSLDTKRVGLDSHRLPAAERLLFAYVHLNDTEKANKVLLDLEKQLSVGEFSYLKGRFYLLKADQNKDADAARADYANAATAFIEGHNELKESNVSLAVRALNASTEADARTQYASCCKRALKNLESASGENQEKLAYVQGLVAAYLVEAGQLPASQVIEQIENTLAADPANPSATKSRYLIAILYYKDGRYNDAIRHFLQVANDPALAGEAYFWAAKSLESSGGAISDVRAYKQKVFEEYPKSTFADEAYFTYYTYREYLQGDRAAVKHLQRMAELFPNSRYTINAAYLIGMDFKRDRKSLEGKSLRKRDLNSSIEAFHDAESSFDRLYAANQIPDEQLLYFAKIRYRAILERAMNNLAIGEESQGAKKKIFYEYAVEVLKHTVDELNDAGHPYANRLMKGESYPQLLEESSFWLAQGYIKLEEDDKADKIYDEMIKRYAAAKITRGYFLSRVWYEKGLIAVRGKKYESALDDFAHAEESGKGKLLSTDQKIDLWIQQSLTYKEMGDNERAMMTLSKAINDDAISSLRVKAMYLRSEVYEAQGRHELARKQLEATSKKGGEWALKARQKMEKEYGLR